MLALTGTAGDGVVLRFGLFYGPAARSTDEALRLARMHMAPIIGRGDGYMSSLHVDDAATAVVEALDAPAGVYNVADDDPVTRREYTDAFAAAFDLPHLRLPPASLTRAVAGRNARERSLPRNASRTDGSARQPVGHPRTAARAEGWAAIAVARRHDSDTSTGDESVTKSQ